MNEESLIGLKKCELQTISQEMGLNPYQLKKQDLCVQIARHRENIKKKEAYKIKAAKYHKEWYARNKDVYLKQQRDKRAQEKQERAQEKQELAELRAKVQRHESEKNEKELKELKEKKQKLVNDRILIVAKIQNTELYKLVKKLEENIKQCKELIEEKEQNLSNSTPAPPKSLGEF
tara:strand:- start:9 stop:536 length:528 start_codon:yes stop_codon:yes gene_type:complete